MSDNIRMFMFELDEDADQDLLKVVDQHLKSNDLPINVIDRRVYLDLPCSKVCNGDLSNE